MFCPKCGNEVSGQKKFCPKCGASVQGRADSKAPTIQTPPTKRAPTPQRQTSTALAVKPPKTRKPKALLIAIPVLAVLIVVALLRFSSRGTANAKGAETKLLGYIDQAEELVTKAYGDVSALSDEESYSEKFRDQANIIEQLVSDLSDVKKKADAVNCPDTKFSNAQKEYFSMLCDAQKSYSEIRNFLADYFDFFDSSLNSRPYLEDYFIASMDVSFPVAYYNDLQEWYESAKEEYAAINSCPSCMESLWKAYEKTLDLNSNILTKIAKSYNNNDWLSFYSALYMENRYYTADDVQYSGFIDCMKGEQDFFVGQKNIAFKLAEELHTYAELGEKERDAYEFEYVRTGKIGIEYDVIDTIYPSLYNTYDAFVVVKTGCASGTRRILIEAEIPGFTQKYAESFTLGSAYRAIYIKPPALTGDLDLSSAKDAQINVTISEQDGTLIEAKTFPITIKSKYDVEWYTSEYGIATQDNILCFLTPESPAISQLKRQAIEEMSAMSDGTVESFVGYQTIASGWNRYAGTYFQAAGIMSALRKMGIRYTMDPFSSSGSNQHVLFPEDVLERRSGLCIETALVVASALQSANMHAFLVFPPGHAQVAVEVWNSGEGAGEYFLIETTALSENQGNTRDHFIQNKDGLLEWNGSSGIITYYDADGWNDYLSGGDTYVIDCDDSRILGLTPFAN